MRTCTYPDCDKLTEGNTDFCGTHNREARRREKLGFAPFYKKKLPKGSAYTKKANRWKDGKKCALHGHSNCVGMITVHHKRGRIGELLMNEKYWLPVCIGHHRYIEDHPEESYRNGCSELRLSNEPHNI